MGVNRTRAVRLAAVGCALILAGQHNAQAVTFNLIPDVGMNPTAIAGFQSAANYWSAILSDNITVNLNIGYSNLGSGILGSTQTSTVSVLYSGVRSALTSDQKSASDGTAVAHLTSGSYLSFRSNNLTTGASFIDNNFTGNNASLSITTANAKALGFTTSATSDASISFSSTYAWDFNRADGISAGQFDFVGTAIHEIGHALGFMSGADVVDFYAKPNGPGVVQGNTSLDNYAVLSVLDLYRYSNENSLIMLDNRFGGSPYFSIDGGTTKIADFSNGAINGDGEQASHWKDDLGIGIMDPTGAPGELLSISPTDILAMDVIGYDVVPEPATFSMMLAMASLPLLRVRRAR